MSTPIQAVIIDDEEDSREVTKNLLARFCPEIHIIGEAFNINKGYEVIIDTKPQVVFLDIHMPGGNGFELLKKFTHIPFEVVFISSYDQYAIDAIKFSALDYLLKPIEVADLLHCIAKIKAAIQKKESKQLQFINVIEHIDNVEAEKKVVVHNHDKVVLLPLQTITHLTGERNYTIIHTLSQGKFTSSKNLAEFEEMFANFRIFLGPVKA